MFSEGTSPSPPARRIVIPVRNLAKSPQLGSSLRKSQQSSPLRSVENKLLCSSAPGTADFAGSTSKVKGGKADSNPPSTFSINMENIKNADISTIEKTANIRKEPFADHYAVESEIGRGKFAVVKRCRKKQNGVQYAAKFLRKRRKGKDCRHDALQEIQMLQTALIHPRLVDLVEVFETSHEIVIVTEYAAGGELFQHIIMEERFVEVDVIRLLRQVLEGLVFLHDRNIVHLDVKPQNILLTKQPPAGDIKLCDFGFARSIHSGEDIRDIIGTPDYVAPEVLSYEPLRTACDMWSVGVLAYVMLTGYSPFAGDTKQEMFLNISQVNLDFPDDLFGDITPFAVDFMTKLLVREPKERMSSRECLSHPWLRQNSIPSTPLRSPFGSPVGCRRALTPPSPDAAVEMEPTKKCRCDDEVLKSTEMTPENLVEIPASPKNGNRARSVASSPRNNISCTPPGESDCHHVAGISQTDEQNNGDGLTVSPEVISKANENIENNNVIHQYSANILTGIDTQSVDSSPSIGSSYS